MPKSPRQKKLTRQTNDRLRIVKRIQALRQAHAVAIIAAGLETGVAPHWEDVLYRLCEERTAADHARLNGFLEQLEREVPGATRIDDVTTADDLLVGQYAPEWGRLGFLLGVAVGMQLGPHAFDGGAR